MDMNGLVLIMAKFWMSMLTASVFVNSVGAGNISSTAIFPGYDKWVPLNSTRDDLYCPENCFTGNTGEDEECCSCQARACWEIDASQCGVVIIQLHIEYTDIFGNAEVVDADSVGTHSQLFHRNGRLAAIPDNICDWASGLLTLDFGNNRISEVSQIKCLTNLDVLKLDSNAITFIPNDTFSNMAFLRVLDISCNQIERLDPNTIKIADGNIFYVNISYNIVNEVDITNILRPGAFCKLNYENCSFETQTNILDVKVNEDILLGPGDINLNKTSGTVFLNFSLLGIEDYTNLYKFTAGTIWADSATFYCDCNLYPLLSSLKFLPSTMFPTLNVGEVYICDKPEHMKGVDLVRLHENQDFDKLTCDLIENCPYMCNCLDQPSQGRIFVNCSYKDLNSLPSDMPIVHWNDDKLDIRFVGNHITTVENRNYLDRIQNIDLSDNDLQFFQDDAINNLLDATINLDHHNIQRLPYTIQRIRSNQIHFGRNPVKCDCDNLWIGDWIRFSSGSLVCSIESGTMSASDISFERLQCTSESPNKLYINVIFSVTGTLCFIGLLLGLSICFKNEILLLKRKVLRNKHAVNGDVNIFVSFCEDNGEVFKWLESTVLPILKRTGYKLTVPFFDVVYGGENKEDQVLEMIRNCETSIIFLCKFYLSTEDCVYEFQNIWDKYVKNCSRNIIVVNFDNLHVGEIRDARLRAFRRLKLDLNYKCRASKLIERLQQELGPTTVKHEGLYDNEQAYHDGNHEIVPPVPWYLRLNQPKQTECNCKYRKCYLHGEIPNFKFRANEHLRGIKGPESLSGVDRSKSGHGHNDSDIHVLNKRFRLDSDSVNYQKFGLTKVSDC